MSAPAHELAANGAPDGALRIVVVDADDRTRGSIVGLLGIRDRFRVVGSAGDLDEAVRLVRSERPDAVVLDPRLPEVTDGVACIRAIRRVDPAIRILALGWSPQLEQDSLAAGADAFVRKTFKPGDLSDAIARCMAAGAILAPAASEAAGDADPATPDPAPSGPTRVPGTGLIL